MTGMSPPRTHGVRAGQAVLTINADVADVGYSPPLRATVHEPSTIAAIPPVGLAAVTGRGRAHGT
ncbi:hypothetical protein [Corynebacterium heidelbergense]|uniref:hypothetical protein n=1 Tax=Corynebacterium heidelbergense TaxID=2055947 RepID=UPI0011BEE571|nr:hypothetical protein [Corynebacterium heidelbergense]